MVTTIFDKLKQLDSSMETMSQFSHTGEQVDQLLSEPEVRAISSRKELHIVVEFILERLRQKSPDSIEYATTLTSLTGLLERCHSEEFFQARSVAVEYHQDFETSKSYTLIVRALTNNQVLTMTHLNLT